MVVVVIVVLRKRKPKVAVVEEVTPEVLPEEAPAKPEEDALEALKDRYAKGEITKEEYEQLKSVLEEE
ncbi:MAG: SHOCT domain-containing protein [Theionarchaea archaeon]|nr:SHOCT domain-containing protein [Theionarchaea archaeon]